MASSREKFLASAQRHLEKGNLARAIKEYQKALDIQPDDIRTRLRIGDLQARLDKRSEAIETYEGVAREYYARGFLPKAVAVLKQIMRLDSSRTDIQLQLAQLYLHMNLLSDSLAQFKAVADQYQKWGRSEELVEVLLQIIDIDPFDVAARVNLGEHYSSKGQLSEAADHFAVAADQLREQNRIDEYVKVAERYFFHRPDDVDRLKELVHVYLLREDYKRALAKLQLVFKSAPKDATALKYLADAFLGLKKRQRAVRVLKELAELHINEGQEELAVEVYRRVFTLDPEDLDSRFHLGLSLPPGVSMPDSTFSRTSNVIYAPPPRESSATGQKPLDREEFGRERPRAPESAGLYTYPHGIVSLQPSLSVEQVELIHRMLLDSDGFLSLAMWDRGLAALTQVLGIDPDNVSAMERMVQMYLHQGSVLDAIYRLINMTRRCWPADPARAAGYLNECLRLDPNHPAARALRTDLGLDGVDLGSVMREGMPVEEETIEVTRVRAPRGPTHAEASYAPSPDQAGYSDEYGFYPPTTPGESQPGRSLPPVMSDGYDEITRVAPKPEGPSGVAPDMGWAKSFSSQHPSPTPAFPRESGSITPSPTPHVPGYTPDEPTGVYTREGEPVYQPHAEYEVAGDLDDLFLEPDESAVPIEEPSPAEEALAYVSETSEAPLIDAYPSAIEAEEVRSDTHPLFGRKAETEDEEEREEVPEVEAITLPPAASQPASVVIGGTVEKPPPPVQHEPASSTPRPVEPAADQQPVVPQPIISLQAPRPAESAETIAEKPTPQVAKAPERPGEAQPVKPQIELPPLPDDIPEELRDELNELEFLMSSGMRDDAQDQMFELTMNYPEYTPLIMERMALLEGHER